MRICSPQLGLDPNSVLGGEICDYYILRGLAKLGVKIDILLPKNRHTDLGIKNWHISRLPFTHIPAYLFNLLELPYLFKTYRQTQFSILRLHAPYFTGVGAWFFHLFCPQVKIVATYHQARHGFLFDLINRLFINRWDLIITDSHAARNNLLNRYNLNPNKLVAIHNGAPEYIKPTTKNKKLLHQLNLSGKQVLLFMGLLTMRKNPLFLIKVIKQLKSNHPDIVLIICGEGQLKPHLLQLIKQYKLQKQVLVIDPVLHQAKNDIFNLADIFVHPSLHEGFPVVVVEAMTCGKPVVISSGYSASEAVTEGQEGYLAKINDVDDWVKKITKLLNDPSLRDKMGRQALTKAKRYFTWEISTQQHLAAFNRLLHPPS